jgi:hypothetical protein
MWTGVITMTPTITACALAIVAIAARADASAPTAARPVAIRRAGGAPAGREMTRRAHRPPPRGAGEQQRVRTQAEERAGAPRPKPAADSR